MLVAGPLVEGDALLASAEAADLLFGPAMDVRRMRTEYADRVACEARAKGDAVSGDPVDDAR